LAAIFTDCSKAKLLLEKDPGLMNSCDEQGFTPLHVAACNGQREIVKMLLERGADANSGMSGGGCTPLLLAQDEEVVKHLILHKADLNAHWVGGHTILQAAAESKNQAKVKLLLAAGAHYDIRSAILLGDLKQAQTLLGRDPALASRKEERLLYWACRVGNVGMIKLLLQYKADPNRADNGCHPSPRLFAIRT
jgi:ankyrin repeat protein